MDCFTLSVFWFMVQGYIDFAMCACLFVDTSMLGRLGSHFDSFLGSLGLHVAPLWVPLGAIWAPRVSLWVVFSCFLFGLWGKVRKDPKRPSRDYTLGTCCDICTERVCTKDRSTMRTFLCGTLVALSSSTASPIDFVLLGIASAPKPNQHDFLDSPS